MLLLRIIYISCRKNIYISTLLVFFMKRKDTAFYEPTPKKELHVLDVYAQICYDSNRTTGYYYANLAFDAKDNHSNGFSSIDNPTQTHHMEVILSGPGLNKAKKKIEKQLASKGIFFPAIHITLDAKVKEMLK